MTEDRAFKEMTRTDKEWEDAHEKAESLRKQFCSEVSGGKVIRDAVRALDDAGISELETLESIEIEKLQAYQLATQKWLGLRWPK
ncbi:MAG: hypothetical protein ACE5Q6_04640 [Dehalococcoidia bacterium]